MTAKKKSKKKPVLKKVKTFKKVKEKTLAEKTLMSYTKEQLVEKINELREVVKELESEKQNYENNLKAAKSYYLQESIFSKKYSNEVLQETSKLFGIPVGEI